MPAQSAPCKTLAAISWAAADTETWSWSYIARHNEAGRVILEAITKGTSGKNVAIADLGTQEYMQAMGAQDTRLPPWLAQETTISEMRQDGEEKDRTTRSFGITAPEDRLKVRPDIMMVDLTTNDLKKVENRTSKKCKADGEQTTLKNMIDQKKLTILEIGYVADTRYGDKYKAKTLQHRSLCQTLEKEGHGVKLYPIILGRQGSVFDCFKAAMSAGGVQGPQQMALARKLHDPAVTSLMFFDFMWKNGDGERAEKRQSISTASRLQVADCRKAADRKITDPNGH